MIIFTVIAMLLSGCKASKKESSTEASQPKGASQHYQTSEPPEVNSNMNKSDPPTSQSIETSEILSHSSEESLDKLITTAYPQEELIRFLSYFESDNFNTVLDHLDEHYPVECLRNFDDSLTYCIYKLQEGGLLYVFFHGTSLKFADYVFVVKEPLTQDSFRKIKKGSNLADVEAVDPGTKLIHSTKKKQPYGMEYLWKKQTYHMVQGGFMAIQYTTDNWEDYGNYRVESIEFVPNGSPLIKGVNDEFYCLDGISTYRLLPQDYPD